MAQLYGRWRNDPEYWLEAEYRVRRQAFGDWGKGGRYFMGAPHQALLMVRGVGDPYFSSVVFLCHGDVGLPAIDSSSYARTISQANSGAIDTSLPKFGAGCLSFPASNDGFQCAGDSALDLASVDFTAESWVYRTSVAAGFRVLVVYQNGTAQNSNYCYSLSVNGAQSRADYFNGNTQYTSTAGNLTASTWSHVAAVKSGSTLTVYLDGTGGTGITVSGGNSLSGSPTLNIGRDVGSVNTWGGSGARMDDIRITKGVARYTSNFTPPTAAFPNF